MSMEMHMGGDGGWGNRGRVGDVHRMMVYARIGSFVTLGLGVTLAVPAAMRAQQAASAASSLVFEGVTVVDVEQGRLVPNQRVVIVGNRIQTVSNAGAGQPPKDGQIVEARGKYLIPGLWDMHVHTHWPTSPASRADLFHSLFLANGVTGIRDAYSQDSLETMVRRREEILAGTRVGPPRQLFTGTKEEIHQGQPEKITEGEVRALKARGAKFIKLYPFTAAAAGAVKRVGLPFGGHLMYVDLFSGGGFYKMSAFEASDSGMSILDHVNAAGELDELCWGGREDASVEACQPLAEQMQASGTWWAPTLIAFAQADASALLMGPATWPVYARYQARVDEFWAGSFLRGNWLRDSAQTAATEPGGFLHIAREAGMPILAGSDAPTAAGNLIGGFSLHAELAILVAEGLTPLQALQAATLNPAKMLRGTDSLGTVAPGKLADLVLLDADPLADITNTTTIRGVVANGRYADRTALDRMLDEVRAKVNEPTP